MTRKRPAIPANAASIRRGLLRWYDREARDLPWRRTKDPYQVWLAEIMLQQTRVDQGTPYFERFLEKLPTVNDLAAASEGQVLKLWEGLGYYSRARNLHKAAKRIVAQGDGFPETAEQWQTLPGVGRYTAGAVASIAYGQRTPVVDGNVTRVLARLFNVSECVDKTATKNRLWSIAETLVPKNRPGDFNQAMMELGARVCTPRKPQCGTCPVKRYCVARARGIQGKRPVRTPRKPTPHHEIVVAAIRRNGRYLVGKRPSAGLLGGLWEFPGGKVQHGETHEEALAREIKEELGIRIRIGGQVACVKHAYSHFSVTLNVYACTLGTGTPTPAVHTEIKWLLPAQFDRYAFPKANHKFLHVL